MQRTLCCITSILILTLAGGLSAALVLGFITQKLRMSPHCGLPVGRHYCKPLFPRFCRRCGHGFNRGNRHIILLMFGVGLPLPS